MPAPANLVNETTTGTGTGNLTLVAVNGKQTFATAFSTGVTTNVFDYFISNRDAAEYERGTGHMSDATTLVRDTVIESTNANSAVSFSVGTKDVTNDVPAGKQIYDARYTTLAGYGITDARGQGKETIWVPAHSMVARTTNGAAYGQVQQTTNLNMIRSLDFDTTTQQFAQFSVWFPKSWNLGTVTFQPSFSQLTTAAGGVVFGLAGVAVSDGDALDVAFGTAQTSTKTAGTANLEYQGPESSAITIAGTPTAGDRVMFQVNRTVADAGDTLAQNARLHGVRLFFTINAATDA